MTCRNLVIFNWHLQYTQRVLYQKPSCLTSEDASESWIKSEIIEEFSPALEFFLTNIHRVLYEKNSGLMSEIAGES